MQPKYKFFFWFSFGLSVIYWFIGYKAVSKIKKGTFGVNLEFSTRLIFHFYFIQGFWQEIIIQ